MTGIITILSGVMLIFCGNLCITRYLSSEKENQFLILKVPIILVSVCLLIMGGYFLISGGLNLLNTSEEQFQIAEISEFPHGYEILSCEGRVYYYYESLYRSQLSPGDIILAVVSPMRLFSDEKEINSFKILNDFSVSDEIKKAQTSLKSN
jgi:hypothetical protein